MRSHWTLVAASLIVWPSWGRVAAQETIPWVINATPSVEIGLADDDPRYQLAGVSDAMLAPWGDLLVVNQMSQQVFGYSRVGEFRFSIGREGDGPGEFRTIASLEAYADTLFVFDSYWQRISAFYRAREFVRDMRLTPPADQRVSVVGRLVDDRWFAREVEELQTTAPGFWARDSIRFSLLDSTGISAEGVLATVPAQITSSSSHLGRSGYRPAPFTPHPLHDVHGGCLYVTASDEPVVDVVSSDGVLVKSIRIPIEARVASNADFAVWFDFMTQDVPPEAMSQARGFLETLPKPDTLPLFAGLVVDAWGYIWLQEWEAPFGVSSQWTVLTPTGELFGRTELPHALTVFEIGEDYVLGVGEGPFDVEVLRLFNLTRTGRSPRAPEMVPCIASLGG